MNKHLLFRSMMIFSAIFVGLNLMAQLPEGIYLNPLNSDGYSPVTITFDPNLACDNAEKTLIGESKIQMHSSAHTTYSPMGGWGNYGIDYNAVPMDGQHLTTDLTNNGNGTFSITLTPSDFYGVPVDSGIIGLSIVFNNGSWAKEGKDKNGATCKDFTVWLTNEETSVKSPTVRNRFTFSPNPVSDILRISSSEDIQSVKVSDVLGKEIIRISGKQNGNLILNTQNLVRGVYIISVYDAKGFAGSSKIIKQ